MSKQYDVVALGELLIDFSPARGASGEKLFQANPGGAPANVLAALSRLGQRTAMIGKVGEDLFGHQLIACLAEQNIDISGLSRDTDVRTTLAFVDLDDTGNRSFSFFRNPGADQQLSPQDVPLELVCNTSFFHFGSLSLTHEPSRSATRHALDAAKDAGVQISYDPNLRLALWTSPQAAKQQIMAFMPYADVLKISDEELFFLLGHDDLRRGAQTLMGDYGIRYVFITLGEHGAYFSHANGEGWAPAYAVKVVDTTGSGDAFMGAMLSQLCQASPQVFAQPDSLQLKQWVSYANAAGSATASSAGAIPAMPTHQQIQACMTHTPPLPGPQGVEG